MGYMRSTLYVSASTAILVVTFLSHGALGQRAQGVSGTEMAGAWILIGCMVQVAQWTGGV